MPKPEQRNIIAIDQSTHTGWACRVNGQRFSGEWDCSRDRREGQGMIFVRFNKCLRDLDRELLSGLKYGEARWRIALYEHVHHRGGAPTEVCAGIVGLYQSFLLDSYPGCQIIPIHANTLKKWLTGRGNVKKPEVIAACNERFASLYPDGPTANDNIADARAMLEYGIEKYIGVENFELPLSRRE